MIPANVRVMLTGITQTGKTTLVKMLLRSVARFIIYDTKQQYSALGHVVHNLQDLHAALKAGVTRFVYQSANVTPEDFDQVCRYVYLYLRNMLLVVEELQIFCSYSKITPWFMKLLTISQGENYNGASHVGVWGITQQPVRVHWDFKSQVSIIVTFRLGDKDAEDLGRVKSPLLPHAAQIVTLQRGEHIVYSELEPFDKQVARCAPIRL